MSSKEIFKLSSSDYLLGSKDAILTLLSNCLDNSDIISKNDVLIEAYKILCAIETIKTEKDKAILKKVNNNVK